MTKDADKRQSNHSNQKLQWDSITCQLLTNSACCLWDSSAIENNFYGAIYILYLLTIIINLFIFSDAIPQDRLSQPHTADLKQINADSQGLHTTLRNSQPRTPSKKPTDGPSNRIRQSWERTLTFRASLALKKLVDL